MENPFAGLRPEMRSEHDEIRKGIFSRALRNMQFSPLAERREWCRAIRATYAATQAARQKRAAATSGTKSSDDGSGANGGTASPSASPAVGTKRTRDAAQLTDGPTSSGKSTGSVETAETPLATSTASPPTTQGLATDGDAGGEEEESEASVKECIAAYLRSLLDRVVGVSLENLNVPALRILCTMVGIHTEVRNKIGLYSTLASFYYTECEKLGKRVSKDTIFERQAAQEAAMLRRLPASTNANAASSSSATKRGGEKTATPQQQQQQNKSTTEAKAASSRSASGKASPAAVVVSVTSHRRGENAVGGSQGKEKEKASSRSTSTKAEQQQQPAAAAAAAGLTHYLKYENATEAWEAEDAEGTKPQSSLHASHNHLNSAYGGGEEEDGEVVYEERVFARRGGASTASSSSSSPHMTKYASSAGEDDGWSAPMVERKIASIVQLHDPVTVAIVVKKLAQLGYRAGNVEATVEQVLRRFHDRQLIFYDNGIAYLM